MVLVGVHLLSVFPFGLLAEGDGYGHELAVLLQQLLYLCFLKILLAVIVNIEHDVRASLSLLCVLDGEFWRAVARPLNSLCPVLITLGDDFHLL